MARGREREGGEEGRWGGGGGGVEGTGRGGGSGGGEVLRGGKASLKDCNPPQWRVMD